MTVSPGTRPLPPVLSRMALGLLIAGVGALLTWQGATIKPTPGMGAETTPINVALDGPLPNDLARSAILKIDGDRTNLNLGPLPAGSALAVGGQVTHRVRNPVQLRASRGKGQLDFGLTLRVQSIDRAGVTVSYPEPVQHVIDLGASRSIPLTISTRTLNGDQTLDLSPLRLRALNVRSVSGNQTVMLPARAGGPFALVSTSGDIDVTAPDGANPEAVRVNTVSGDLSLELAGAKTGTLGAGTGSGNVALTLPAAFSRGTVTTASGDVTVTAPADTRGNLDIRTQSGEVTLRAAPGLRLRVRFTDRDTLTLPRGQPPANAPDLDVFIDAPGDKFTLEPLSE
ncbi:DUF4097 family beta strand repeat-containing protein [Deinococcus arenicola]|uniref:DUF4097 family beta strand repeat-containing protein n=1 Tax=Deinococcus arenicola TaxID=2994950 RepID=A0ABU4DQH0_9DEIO|nr:DUF4097 family beta strand repeat-containing protein [Deinococcus sp. ZS9-10]MDV6374686.1 DUF4097 family beta strand repeat-containing protein [Deinococcus sp. ZS9-10]